MAAYNNLDTVEDVYNAVNYLKGAKTTLDNKDLAFKCIRKAMFFKDLDLEFEARYEFLQQCCFLNYQEEMIAQYPWFLKICDEHPGRFRYSSVLWAFKWVINLLPGFHNISLEKINSLLSEFERRYRDFGATDRVIQYCFLKVYSSLGKHEKTLEAYEAYKRAPAKWERLMDCSACELNSILDVFIDTKDYKTAIEMAQPILSGKLTCAEVPMITYPKLIIPAIELGEEALAEDMLYKTLKELNGTTEEVEVYCQLLPYLSIKGDFVTARKIFEAQFPSLKVRKSDFMFVYFYMYSGIVFKCMARKDKPTVKLAINGALPLDHLQTENEGEYYTEKLQLWFEEMAFHYATLLDNRNGNNHYNEFVEENLLWVEKYC
ncbi:hypothetical protein LVD15_01025 [Fulvivirga maritima]|uniref:hypothetical protein n=1 Tax=Fulvivirga maritima TaxID=2904247 RepID=UPI001F24EA25|nr:hypothetical protein [Fulvivirga maritima]UII27048.1 hypothetical protein LVD15_01025 [Fulvivirga maritima]